MKPSYGILSRSVYSMAISHGSSCSRDPPLFSMPFRAIPSPVPPPTSSSSPTVSVRMPDLKYLLPCVPTIFRINREQAVDLSLFSSPLEWWGRSPAWEVSVRSSPTTLSVDPCTILMRLLEAFWENETHRLRDSTLHTLLPQPVVSLEMDWVEPCLFEVVRELVVGWLSVQWFMSIKAIR